MTIEHVDALVIGAGQAGPSLAVRCAQQGLKTVLVERGALGGTCINNGCVPTKAWVASARAAQVARRAAEWGVVLDGAVRVDMAKVRARKDALIAASHASLAKWIEGTPNLQLLRGAPPGPPVRWPPTPWSARSRC
jgi:pyruvate/2-oxoglutarate dehydrogenase complex dihydrolipoamide dehydrogenase (E3) component